MSRGNRGKRGAQPESRASFLPQTTVSTSGLNFSPSSFMPLKAATHRKFFRAFRVFPERTIQRIDSGTHLGARMKSQWLTLRLLRSWKNINRARGSEAQKPELPYCRFH